MKAFANHKKVTVFLASLLFLCGVMTALELTDTTHFFHEEVPSHTASQYTKGEPLDDNSSPTTNPASPAKTRTDASDTKLEQPNGNFVSSHHVKPSSRITSSCNTTPGAKCVISFTKGSETKALPAETADSGGATYWNWQPSDLELSEGKWDIQATAILGDQKLTASDVLTLDIAQ